jgi:uncharacterized membrane protein YjdF
VEVKDKLAWFAAAAAIALNIAAYAFSLYDLNGFDEVVHACTFFAAAIVLQRVLRDDLPHPSRRAAFLFVLVSCSLALGVVWEWMEWSYDFFTAQNSILGKQDTMVDLVVDAVGALVAANLLLRFAR